MGLNKEDFIKAAGGSHDAAVVELADAIEKHGLQNGVTFEKQFMILMEEVGEVAKDLIDGKLPEAMKEIHQVLAMVYKLAAMIGEVVDKLASIMRGDPYDPNELPESLLKHLGYKSVATIGYMKSVGLIKITTLSDAAKLYLIPVTQIKQIKVGSALLTVKGNTIISDEVTIESDPEFPFGDYSFGVVK